MPLIDNLIKKGNLKTDNIIKAFQRIKRSDFIINSDNRLAELNEPLPIGQGQTISQPLTVANMLEMLKPAKNDIILDVGCGSGWTTALLAEIVGERGRVYGLEIIKELAERARNNVAKYNFISRNIVQIFCQDGYGGLPQFAPFDKILVSAAAENIPANLLSQLAVGGRMVIPVGRPHRSQAIMVLNKIKKNKFNKEIYPGYIFVPLVKKYLNKY